MEHQMKKPYNKPGIVYINLETNEMIGDDWFIEKIVRETEAMEQEQGKFAPCPFEDMGVPCNLRQ